MKLFTEYKLAGKTIRNRITMAPLTRARSPGNVANERNALYYAQRASAGFIVSEGTPISREGQGYLFNPGIFTDAQIKGWRLTTDSVHALGGIIFAQLWHVGRVSHTTIQENNKAPVSSTTKRGIGAMAYGYNEEGKPGLIESSPPRALETTEVKRVIQDFSQAAENAIKAGFDGVEIHGANGYLIEQFLNPLINDRIDEYAGSPLENRIRFALEIVDAVSEKIGSKKVGIRLSPFAQVFDMPFFEETEMTYIKLCQELKKRQIAYVHFMDHTNFSVQEDRRKEIGERFSNLVIQIRKELPDVAIVLAGGMTKESAEKMISENIIDFAAFGTPFISNPDLVERLKNNWPLSMANRETFYGGGAEGYIDYPPYSPEKGR